MSKFTHVDIHTHVHFEAFDDDRDAVIARAREAGVAMINVGTTLESSKAAVALAKQYGDGVYATIGLHPTHAYPARTARGEQSQEPAGREVEQFDASTYRELAENEKTVAIGECGLDYFHLDEESKKTQQNVFEQQVAFAVEARKPLMLHIRPSVRDGIGDAYEDAYAILKNHPGVRGNVHFFVGNQDQAELFLNLGFTLSFTGVLTFASDYNEVVKNAPIDMIMAETDAPFVAPVPYRGTRNEPSYVVEVVKQIAGIRDEDEREVARALAANAQRVFGL